MGFFRFLKFGKELRSQYIKVILVTTDNAQVCVFEIVHHLITLNIGTDKSEQTV